MSGDTNIVGFACWFARICFTVRGVDLICSTTDLSCCLFDRRERLGQTPFGSRRSVSSWYQSRRVSHGVICYWDRSAEFVLLVKLLPEASKPKHRYLFVQEAWSFLLWRSNLSCWFRSDLSLFYYQYALLFTASRQSRSDFCWFPSRRSSSRWTFIRGVFVAWSIYPVSSYSTFPARADRANICDRACFWIAGRVARSRTEPVWGWVVSARALLLAIDLESWGVVISL
jgi:hypothetical protein